MNQKKQSKQSKYKCKQCGREMNLLEYFIGDVCMSCCRKNHKRVTGHK